MVTLSEDSSPNTANELPLPLRQSSRDWWVAVARSLAGAVPLAGGAVVEALSFIPKLRQERVIEFLAELARRFDELEKDLNAKNALSVDLFESAVLLAARAVTPQRNQFLVNLMEEAEDVGPRQYEVDKKILHVLEEITDQDIEVLKAHATFADLTKLERDWPRPRSLSSADRQNFELKLKYSIHMVEVSLLVHRQTLLRFGLLERKPTTKEVREVQGLHLLEEKQEMLPYQITTLGRMLLTRVYKQSFLVGD